MNKSNKTNKNQTGQDFQPILTKLEQSKRINPLLVLLIVILGIGLLITGLYFFFAKKNNSDEPVIENDEQASESTSQAENTNKDPYDFIYNPPTEPDPITIDEEGNLTEEAAFSAEEIEKIEKYFGPLPEKKENIEFQREKIRGIYIYDTEQLDAHLQAIEGTEVNAFIIDVKESFGLLYESQIPLAKEVNAISQLRDLKNIFGRCHEKDIKVIARIVCFKDTTLAANRPDLTIANENGQAISFPLEGNVTFANPYDSDVWQYLIDIAKEVIELGADEIQFDYVRFPSGGSADGSAAYFGEPEEVPAKTSAINRFLQTAAVDIQDNLGIPVGADLFSIVMTSEIDGLAIGQDWMYIGLTGIDNICPMIYPSHYANASLGSQGNGVGSFIGNNFYEAPDLDPYGVVTDAFIDGSSAIEQEGYAYIRPYLQAFTASYLPEGYYMTYGAQDIRDQIVAAYDAGFDEWILWNASGEYPTGAFMPKDNN